VGKGATFLRPARQCGGSDLVVLLCFISGLVGTDFLSFFSFFSFSFTGTVFLPFFSFIGVGCQPEAGSYRR
jgi:hypothetical protein